MIDATVYDMICQECNDHPEQLITIKVADLTLNLCVYCANELQVAISTILKD